MLFLVLIIIGMISYQLLRMLRLIFVTLTVLLAMVNGDEMVGVIVDNFNSKNFSAIYEHFDSDLKKAISEQQFSASMTPVRESLGVIQDYVTIDVGRLYIICQTNLDTGTVNYELNDDGEFKSFFIKYQAKSTFKYLYENRKNSKVALSFTNPKHAFSMNEKASLSICSVYKITLVAEYARQVTAKIVDPLLCVDLSVLNKYYMPHVDTGHASWIKTVKKTCATHQEIVVGMIQWSSNAIAEYLTDLLTPKKVDTLITELGLNHSKTLYVVSSMFAMNNTYNLPRQQWLNMLKLMTYQQVLNISESIHEKLKAGKIDLNKDTFYLDPDVIDIHVQFLERSNSMAYLTFMQVINSNKFFDNATLEIIKLLFDQVTMTSNFAQSTFIHAGAKGGSASYPGMKNNALAVAGYAEMGAGVKASYAFIMNGLSVEMFTERLLDLNLFILALETSEFYVLEFVKRMEAVGDQEKEILTYEHSNLRQIQK